MKKIDGLSPKDKSKCTREIIHSFIYVLVDNSDFVCLCEKIFYDQFLKFYPYNSK